MSALPNPLLPIPLRPPKADAKAAPAKGGKPAKGGAKKVKVVVKVPAGVRRKQRKSRFRAAFSKAVADFSSIMVVGIDNVGSDQLQQTRMKLRELGCIMLVGKNSVIRPLIREEVEKGNKKIAKLIPFVKQNVGFVFTNNPELSKIRDLITENKIPAAARTGAIAPADVHIPAGPTPLDPGMFTLLSPFWTPFFILHLSTTNNFA
jgi:large subunit ribosomal protein LP0